MRVDAASERGGDSGNVGPGEARPLAGELSSIGCDYDRESRRGDRCARKCNANKPPRAPTAPVALPHAFVPGRFRAFPAQQPICASRDRRAARSAPGRSADTAAWRHERASRRTFSRPRSGRAREARQACQCALASSAVAVADAGRGCAPVDRPTRSSGAPDSRRSPSLKSNSQRPRRRRDRLRPEQSRARTVALASACCLYEGGTLSVPPESPSFIAFRCDRARRVGAASRPRRARGRGRSDPARGDRSARHSAADVPLECAIEC